MSENNYFFRHILKSHMCSIRKKLNLELNDYNAYILRQIIFIFYPGHVFLVPPAIRMQDPVLYGPISVAQPLRNCFSDTVGFFTDSLTSMITYKM